MNYNNIAKIIPEICTGYKLSTKEHHRPCIAVSKTVQQSHLNKKYRFYFCTDLKLYPLQILYILVNYSQF